MFLRLKLEYEVHGRPSRNFPLDWEIGSAPNWEEEGWTTRGSISAVVSLIGRIITEESDVANARRRLESD